MAKDAPIPKFEYCQLCTLIAHLTNSEPVCPARNNGDLSDEKIAELREQTPNKRWLTPEEIAEIFIYSTKQIIRIADTPEKGIAAYKENNRWYINYCSMHEHMDKRNSRE